MGREKDRMMRREDALEKAAERDGRRCGYCNTVIPYDTDPGPNGECPACISALKED